MACIVVEESATRAMPEKIVGTSELRRTIAGLVELSSITDSMTLDLVPFLQTLRRKCQSVENGFVEHGKLPSNKLPVFPACVQGEHGANSQPFTFSMAINFCEKEFDKLSAQLSSVHRTKVTKILLELRNSLTESIEDFRIRKEVHERRIVCAAASASLWLGELGTKLNPIIQGIMNAIKVCEFSANIN